MEAEAEAEAPFKILLEAEAEAEAQFEIQMEAEAEAFKKFGANLEAEAEAERFWKLKLEAEAEALSKSSASASLLTTMHLNFEERAGPGLSDQVSLWDLEASMS